MEPIAAGVDIKHPLAVQLQILTECVRLDRAFFETSVSTHVIHAGVCISAGEPGSGLNLKHQCLLLLAMKALCHNKQKNTRKYPIQLGLHSDIITQSIHFNNDEHIAHINSSLKQFDNVLEIKISLHNYGIYYNAKLAH